MHSIWGIAAAILVVACSAIAASERLTSQPVRLLLTAPDTGCAVVVVGNSPPASVCAGGRVSGSDLELISVDADSAVLSLAVGLQGAPIHRKLLVGETFAVQELEALIRVHQADELSTLGTSIKAGVRPGNSQ